jgi:hypothetical protein
MTEDTASLLMLPTSSAISTRLHELARTQRMVFFAGLPGVGKSLLIRELAHIAHGLGRRVHLLQWDVARQSFVSSAVLAKYPDAAGVTHAVIRKAMGLWSRNAVVAWDASNPDATDLLIGETPLIGNRFIELATPMNDDAEALLSAKTTCFLVPLPSREVRTAIEKAREATTANPKHDRERGDARPNVMRAIWEELNRAAALLGMSNSNDANYNLDTYKGVYLNVLKHRRCEVLPVDIVLPPSNRSVYDFQVLSQDLAPTSAEGQAFIERVEQTYPDLAVLEEEIAHWYAV